MFLGRSTGTIVYPQTSDRSSELNMRKSYINYPDDYEFEPKPKAVGLANLLAQKKKKKGPQEGSVKLYKQKTVEKINDMNKVIDELETKGGNRDHHKRPPVPTFKKKVVVSNKIYFDKINIFCFRHR